MRATRRSRLFFTAAFGVVGALLIFSAALHDQRGGMVIMESVPSYFVWSYGYFLNQDGSAFFRTVMVVLGGGLLVLAFRLWGAYSQDIRALEKLESCESECDPDCE